ncbi:MAG: translational GTPase TypA [Candidatus Saccharimonadales bacterium]
MSNNIRNIAVIAHVDHGKTTLVDSFLKQSNLFRDNQAEMSQELLMDSNDQERERGITITAKITAIEYAEHRINIIDTPGHADFSGEVERILHMADGCLLIVDAQEGPMPQTKFVLSKALAAGLVPIVIINKIDKPGARIAEVESELADLFLDLATIESQLQYSIYYAVARDGKAWDTMPVDFNSETTITPVLDAIIEQVPAPQPTPGEGLQLLVTSLAWDNYEGKYAIGRIGRGSVVPGKKVALATPDGITSTGKVDKIYTYRGLARVEAQRAEQGDIIALSGLSEAQIGQTIVDPEHPDALPVIKLEDPTLSIYLGPNTSPLKGKEGDFTTSRQIAERLEKELETNIGFQLEPEAIGFIVSGRGELHLSVLIETMRREGFEFEVGQPRVVYRQENGQTLEPFEEVAIEVPAEYTGTVQSEMGKRRAVAISQSNLSSGDARLIYEMPTRTYLGLRNILVTQTKGTVVMNSMLKGYQPKGPDLDQQRSGALIAFDSAVTTPYALQSVEARGTLFVGPGEKVYSGQIVGLNSRSEDLDVSVTKEKHLTNMRSKSSDGTVQLTPATRFSLEQSLDFLEDDELMEVTPKSIRLRKRELDRNLRNKKR